MSSRLAVRTTLYDVIKAIGDELPPGEHRLVAEVVLHMLLTGKIKFIHDLH